MAPSDPNKSKRKDSSKYVASAGIGRPTQTSAATNQVPKRHATRSQTQGAFRNIERLEQRQRTLHNRIAYLENRTDEMTEDETSINELREKQAELGEVNRELKRANDSANQASEGASNNTQDQSTANLGSSNLQSHGTTSNNAYDNPALGVGTSNAHNPTDSPQSGDMPHNNDTHGEAIMDDVSESDEDTDSSEGVEVGVDRNQIEWDISGGRQRRDVLSGVPSEVFGHLIQRSSIRLCARYGSLRACSSKFETTHPTKAPPYTMNTDVTQRSKRIVEKIIRKHTDEKSAVPAGILDRVKILSIYWESKIGVGHCAEVGVLDPDTQLSRRPNTRCFIYLDPKLYATYKLENTTGYSHETYSTILRCVEGTNNRQKRITIYNIAVRAENKFEKEWLSHKVDRPGPLRELPYDGQVPEIRSYSLSPSRYPSPLSSYEQIHYATPPESIRETPRQSPVRQTPLRQTPLRQTPLRQSPRKSSRTTPQRQVAFQDQQSDFHEFYMAIKNLPLTKEYDDLSDEDKKGYMKGWQLWMQK